MEKDRRSFHIPIEDLKTQILVIKIYVLWTAEYSKSFEDEISSLKKTFPSIIHELHVRILPNFHNIIKKKRFYFCTKISFAGGTYCTKKILTTKIS